MCGRYALTTTTEEVAEAFGIAAAPLELRPRYNIAPTQEAPVVAMSREGDRELRMMRWGLVPFWAKDESVGNRMINARCEGVEEKPAFRHAIRTRRCIIPASGFYEWKKSQTPRGRKQPFYIQSADRSVLGFAGLWERWKPKENPGAAPLESFTILTTEASDSVRQLHDRMPVVLRQQDYPQWLDPSCDDPGALMPILERARHQPFSMHAVSTIVNSPKNDSGECVEPVELEDDSGAAPLEQAQGELFG